MSADRRRAPAALLALLSVMSIVVLASAACGGGDNESSPTAAPTATAEPTSAPTATPQAAATETPAGDEGEIKLEAASATITVDGDSSDWSGIEGVDVPMEQMEIPPGVDWDQPGPLDPIDVTLKVAVDADNIYLLMEAPDDYDFDPADHNFSASVAVMFPIDQAAGIHMGTSAEDFETSLGMVDIWHWELDCGAGVMSGGGDPGSGDDADCNLDDEYATEPEEREDDGGGDVANPDAENSLAGVWEHTARSEGAGASGAWVFEFSRPLQTGDPQDAQFQAGGTVFMALAYFDPDETVEGWTDTGHVQSTENGWIEVTLP